MFLSGSYNEVLSYRVGGFRSLVASSLPRQHLNRSTRGLLAHWYRQVPAALGKSWPMLLVCRKRLREGKIHESTACTGAEPSVRRRSLTAACYSLREPRSVVKKREKRCEWIYKSTFHAVGPVSSLDVYNSYNVFHLLGRFPAAQMLFCIPFSPTSSLLAVILIPLVLRTIS